MLQVPFSWTESNIALLRKDWLEGKSVLGIAKLLGCTRNAVIGKARREGLPQHINACRRNGAAEWHAYAKPRNERPKIQRRDRFRVPKISTDKLPEIVAVDPLNIPFLELASTHCRYPVTESNPHLFCGHPQQTDSSYCAFHHSLCWTPHRGSKA